MVKQDTITSDTLNNFFVFLETGCKAVFRTPSNIYDGVPLRIGTVNYFDKNLHRICLTES